jgi:hypothetical protein
LKLAASYRTSGAGSKVGFSLASASRMMQERPESDAKKRIAKQEHMFLNWAMQIAFEALAQMLQWSFDGSRSKRSL